MGCQTVGDSAMMMTVLWLYPDLCTFCFHQNLQRTARLCQKSLRRYFFTDLRTAMYFMTVNDCRRCEARIDCCNYCVV